MPLTHDDINLYIFLKKVIQFKHMVENWEKDTYLGIPFDPWINEWTKRVFTKRGLPQYVNLFTDHEVFNRVYSGLIFRPELKFLSTPELLKTEEEEGLGDEFHNQVKQEADALGPEVKKEIYPIGPAPVKKPLGEKTPPKFYMAPEEEEEEGTEEEGEEPKTMASDQEAQEPSQGEPAPRTSVATPSIPQAPAPSQSQQSPSLGGQTPQMQMPQVSMPRYSSRPKIPTSAAGAGGKPPVSKPKIPQGFQNSLRGAGAGMGSAFNGLASRGANIFKRPGINAFGPKKAPANILKKSRLRIALFGGFFMFMVVGLIQPLFFSEDQPTAVAAPIVPPGNLASCSFTRADQTPKTASYKSPNLMGFFQEASAISTVPAIVLAGFARVESPSLVNKTDADLTILSNPSIASKDGGCPRSKTGALGVMQLQPVGTKGHDEKAINNGAKYFSKSAETLTETDYCNVRTSIIIASGFLLKKLQYYGYGDGTKWDPSWTNNKEVLGKLGEAYYGCAKYGAPPDENGEVKCDDPRNIYGYGDDILTSVQACKATTPAVGSASCPVPGGRITYTSYDADPKKGHCTLGSVEYPCQEACPTNGRRAKSIDVDTTTVSRDVRLPKINNQTANWKFIQVLCAGAGTYPNCSDFRGGTGALLVFEGTAATSTDVWSLQFVHMGIPHSLEIDKSYASDTVIGKSDIGIVHVSIGKGIVNKLGSGTPGTDCDTGWIAADFMCQ